MAGYLIDATKEGWLRELDLNQRPSGYEALWIGKIRELLQ
jgi:hypothetical protein